jgi:hypothetical protein
MILIIKRGTNLETQLLEVRPKPRPKFFYLGLLNSILKLAFSNVCGLPFNIIVIYMLKRLKKTIITAGTIFLLNMLVCLEISCPDKGMQAQGENVPLKLENLVKATRAL